MSAKLFYCPELDTHQLATELAEKFLNYNGVTVEKIAQSSAQIIRMTLGGSNGFCVQLHGRTFSNPNVLIQHFYQQGLLRI